MERVAILGAGAVGAGIAHQLIRSNPSAAPTLIADEERFRSLQEYGLTVNGEVIRPSVSQGGEFDLVILATKSYHLNDALPLLDRCMSGKTLVMSLLNGIASEELLGQRFGEDLVIPAMILGIDALREGRVVKYLNRGTIFYGVNPKAADQHEAIGRIHRWFPESGLGHEFSENITRTLWHKFMINVAINQVSAVYRAPYGRFQCEGEEREIMMGALREVVELSRLENTGLDETSIHHWLTVLKTLDPEGKTSMLQDAEAGRQTEVDLFAGTVIKLAEKHGLDVPVNRELYRKLTGPT